jgi:hypothetical protein
MLNDFQKQSLNIFQNFFTSKSAPSPGWQHAVGAANGSSVANAANEGCLEGSGVDGSVYDAGGSSLAVARSALPLLNVSTGRGCVRCTKWRRVQITAIGGDLPVHFCILAVGPNDSVYRHD